ncbi:SAM-dependent methyltransferase [soil metagenome]
MKTDTTSQAYFDKKYRDNPDPWGFASSAYEQDRYARIVAALQSRRYKRAFEPGCSIGVLTSYLATICDAVEAIDISPTAVGFAKVRCASLSNVSVECGSLPASIPDAPLDLVVLSEIGYYFSEKELYESGLTLAERMSPGAVLLATHWLGTSNDHILTGDRVHTLLSTLPGFKHDYQEKNPGFRIDRWTKE